MALLRAAPLSPLLRMFKRTLCDCSKASMSEVLASKESWVMMLRVRGAGVEPGPGTAGMQLPKTNESHASPMKKALLRRMSTSYDDSPSPGSVEGFARRRSRLG